MASHVLQMQSHFIKQALGDLKKQRQKKQRSGLPLNSSDEDIGSDEEVKEDALKVQETVTGVLEDFKEQQIKLAQQRKSAMIKNKIKTMGRIGKIYNTLKDQNEVLILIKQMAPDGRIPHGLLLAGKPAIKNAYKQFELARQLDKKNEKRPSALVGKKKPSK